MHRVAFEADPTIDPEIARQHGLQRLHVQNVVLVPEGHGDLADRVATIAHRVDLAGQLHPYRRQVVADGLGRFGGKPRRPPGRCGEQRLPLQPLHPPICVEVGGHQPPAHQRRLSRGDHETAEDPFAGNGEIQIVDR